MWTIAGVPVWAGEVFEETLMSEHGRRRQTLSSTIRFYNRQDSLASTLE